VASDGEPLLPAARGEHRLAAEVAGEGDPEQKAAVQIGPEQHDP
jgi:hypothetical protein